MRGRRDRRASTSRTLQPNPKPNLSNPNPNPNKVSGGFFWEVYKPTAEGEATATATAQAICNAVLPGNARCAGKFPRLAPLVTPRPTPNPGRTDRLVESVIEECRSVA